MGSLIGIEWMYSSQADDLPEQAFLYVGGINDVREKAKSMA